MNIEIGATYRVSATVDKTNTASAAGSGLLEVFATPMMVAMMENAATLALEPFLEAGQASVGSQISVTHDSATPVGMEVTAVATITAVDRKRVDYEVEAFDAAGKIGGGTHTRFIVDTAKFLKKTQEKADS